MANYVYIATSLDGYIAASDGGLDWLMEIPAPGGEDYGYAEFMATIDALVMGRKTFEKVLTFGDWPYDKPVFVLSTTITEVPEHLAGKVEIVHGELKELTGTLNQRGYNNLYIDGGVTIQNFLQQDLIDEMIITKVPTLLGGGIPLFGTLDEPIKFKHVKTEIYDNGLVKSRYSRSS